MNFPWKWIHWPITSCNGDPHSPFSPSFFVLILYFTFFFNCTWWSRSLFFALGKVRCLRTIIVLNQFPESLSNQNFSFCCLSVYCVRGRRNSFVTDELGQTQGRRRRKKTESVPLKQICCSWKLFRQKLVFLFLEKSRESRKKRKKIFFIVFSLVFVICTLLLYSKGVS